MSNSSTNPIIALGNSKNTSNQIFDKLLWQSYSLVTVGMYIVGGVGDSSRIKQ